MELRTVHDGSSIDIQNSSRFTGSNYVGSQIQDNFGISQLSIIKHPSVNLSDQPEDFQDEPVQDDRKDIVYNIFAPRGSQLNQFHNNLQHELSTDKQNSLLKVSKSRESESSQSLKQRNVHSKISKRGARISSISGGKMVFPPNFFGQQ